MQVSKEAKEIQSSTDSGCKQGPRAPQGARRGGCIRHKEQGDAAHRDVAQRGQRRGLPLRHWGAVDQHAAPPSAAQPPAALSGVQEQLGLLPGDTLRGDAALHLC